MIDRSKAPAAYAIEAVSLIHHEIASIKRQEDTLFIPYDQQPVALIELLFESGKWFEQTQGISHFAAKLLTEGTANKDALTISKHFEKLGSHIEINPGLDFISVKVYALSLQLTPTLHLLEEILFEAAFPEAEFELLRKVRKQNLLQQLAKNPQLATLQFNERLFGHVHPYGKILLPESLDHVNIEQIKDFHRTALFHQPRCLVIGKLTNEHWNILSSIMRRFSTSESNPDKIQQSAASTWGRYEITKQATNQASIRIGTLAPEPTHPDIHKVKIANTLLGGFFSSRLMKTIREQKGYTYGIYASLIHLMHASYWMISAEIQKDSLDDALLCIESEIVKLSQKVCGTEELDTLKSYMKGKLLSNLDSVFNIGQLYASYWTKGMSINAIQEFLDTINTITPTDVSDMIREYYVKKEMVTIIVK